MKQTQKELLPEIADRTLQQLETVALSPDSLLVSVNVNKSKFSSTRCNVLHPEDFPVSQKCKSQLNSDCSKALTLFS